MSDLRCTGQQARRRLLLALWVSALFPPAAMACDCVYSGVPCRAFAGTPTVFSGRVTRMTSIGPGTDVVVRFEVREPFRGVRGTTVEVRTGAGGGDCGYAFRAGVDYLVYAVTDAESGGLRTSICQRTRPLSEAIDDLDYLRVKDDPSHRFGIEGFIHAVERDEQNNTGPAAPLAGVTVAVEGPRGRTMAVTRRDGKFSAWGLVPGRYRLTPAFSSKFLPEIRTVTVGANACEEVHVLATPPPR